MNLKEVKKTVNNIKESVVDFEGAHELEDDLYEAVLKEVVSGNPESKEMARIALQTKEINFPRYCS
ncbi:hypothetical protein HUK49_03580 [Limosilactobacillus sp. c11Ua_112_M]|uniref:hypothetical protein n=1 Tax=Limosilactobacillus portuensis TaxID=2742601 RepID=UPI0017842489|nr:hypothetical protein [Limosilactobacillus portuensis]MBD8087046.1 hypothetical protein [Limosilactobacillus portuensis]